MSVWGKVHFSNLGRIADAEVELRPLTIFLGPNNTNKTWAAYAVYALVQSLSASRFFFRTHSAMEPLPGFQAPQNIVDACSAAADQLAAQLLKTSSAGSYVGEFYRSELFDQMVLDEDIEFSLTSKGLAHVLTENAIPENSSAVLRVNQRDFRHGGIINRLEVIANKETGQLRIKPRDSSGRIRYEMSTGYRAEHHQQLRERLLDFVRWVVFGIFEGTAAIPAERNGLLAAYRLLAGAVRQQVPFLNCAGQDFINLLLNADASRRSSGGSQRDMNRMLEEHVLGGKLGFDVNQDSAGLTYTVKDGPAVGIESAASFVRSLAGLYCYFQHFANARDLVVIDEPEMNAHPQAQLRLMEFFASMLQRDYRLLLTTHSPYLLDHLANMLELGRVPAGKRGGLSNGPRTPIDAEQVAVYLFTESGQVLDVFDRHEGTIDLSTFSDCTDDLGNTYAQILGLQRE